MTPWPVEQDVAYAGPGHLNGSRTALDLSGGRRSGDRFRRWHYLALDLRRVSCGHGAFRGSLHLSDGLVGLGDGAVRTLDLPDHQVPNATEDAGDQEQRPSHDQE